MTDLSINWPNYPGSLSLGYDNFAQCRADLTASTLADGFNCIIDAKTTKGDGLGGIYVWDNASVLADDNLTILTPTGLAVGRWLKVGVGGVGPTGPAPTVAIGTVSTLSTGMSATASITGASGVYTLNLGLPTGATGSGTAFAWGAATGTLSSQTDLQNALNLKATFASPTFTGTPAAPTAAASTNTTQLATTAFVDVSFAKKASPALTGTPTAPTASLGTSTTQVATTAFVDALRDFTVNSQAAAYTLVLTDRNKLISITTGGIVVPSNATVAFAIGSVVNIYNDSGTSQSLSITGDTLRQSGTTNTGTRTIAGYGLATVIKVGTTTWLASGDLT